ncbi:MAG: N-acetyltransferase family protein [Sphingobium sp.]
MSDCKERPPVFDIRRAVPEDVPALAALKLRTFRETFVDGPVAVPYSAENLAIFEADSYSEESVLAELNNPLRAQWVAEAADGSLAGYAQAGPCKLPHPEAGPEQGELYQLYVATEWQGFGLGRLLLDAALEWLADTMPGSIWLGVFSGNTKAQAIYAARGFRHVGNYEFKVGTHRDHEFIFRREMSARA